MAGDPALPRAAEFRAAAAASPVPAAASCSGVPYRFGARTVAFTRVVLRLFAAS